MVWWKCCTFVCEYHAHWNILFPISFYTYLEYFTMDMRPYETNARVWYLPSVSCLTSFYFQMRWPNVISYYCCLLSLLLLRLCLRSQGRRRKERSFLLLRSSAAALLRSWRNGCLVMCDSTWSWSFASSQAPRSTVGASHGFYVRSRCLSADIPGGKGFLP